MLNPVPTRKNYLKLRQVADRLGNPVFYYTIRRKAIEAFKSGRYGDLILNVGRGVNLILWVEESIIFDMLGRRP